MTADQKQRIIELRRVGRSYSSVAQSLNLPEGTVKSFCWRNRLASSGLGEPQKNLCRECGQPLAQQPDAPPRKFCCDKCRFNWWRKNRKPNNSAICAGCGHEFHYYGKAKRKYCGQACATNHRFSEVGV